MTRPGARLRSLARRFCDPATMERLIDPAIADLQCEHAEATRAGDRWRGRWAFASPATSRFWKVAAIGASRASTRELGRGRWWRGRTHDPVLGHRDDASWTLVWVRRPVAGTFGVSGVAHVSRCISCRKRSRWRSRWASLSASCADCAAACRRALGRANHRAALLARHSSPCSWTPDGCSRPATRRFVSCCTAGRSHAA